MACRHHVGMTSEELAQEAYLKLGSLDDGWNEVTYSDGMHLLGDLWQRLMPEFCSVEGCGKARLDSFPTCAQHTRERRYETGPWVPKEPQP